MGEKENKPKPKKFSVREELIASEKEVTLEKPHTPKNTVKKGYFLKAFLKSKFLIAAIVLLLLLLPLIIHAFFIPVQFNEFLIQKLELKYLVISPETFADMILSSYSSGLNFLFGNPVRTQPNFDDPRAMFEYIYSWIPPYAISYPTERFYYFNTTINGTPVSGNIRVADLGQGKITMAYFTVGQIERSTHYGDFTEADGLQIVKHSDYLWDVAFNGKKTTFKVPHTDVSPPQKLRLSQDEEFTGHIHDESGVKFFLIFNKKTNSFYDLLDEETGLTDNLEDIGENHLVGKRTGFVFYNDKDWERKVLVGVHLANIAENNYLDGPGDQVPIIINLRDKLHKAYPNTMLGDGVDEHGVYLNKPEWVRIAVTPFVRYVSYEDLKLNSRACLPQLIDRSEFWTCLTKEFWNTKEWRQGIIDQLKEEGKEVPAGIN